MKSFKRNPNLERLSLIVREMSGKPEKYQAVEFDVPKVDADGNPISKSEQKRMIKGLYSTFFSPLTVPGSRLGEIKLFLIVF